MVVDRKIPESETITSFYLMPEDGAALAAFTPGQFLTFELTIPGQAETLLRTYSLSDGPSSDYYRVSIKRVPPPRKKPDVPPGKGSGFFHDAIEEGTIIDVKAPNGDFFLDLAGTAPVVLIGGGIGVTPMVSMLNALFGQDWPF